MSNEIQAVPAVAVPSGTADRVLPLAPLAGSLSGQGPPAVQPQDAGRGQGQQQGRSQRNADEVRALQQTIRELEQRLASARTDLQFRIDRDLDRLVVSVVKSEDGTVVRQIPSEEVQRIAQNIDRLREGLIDEVA